MKLILFIPLILLAAIMSIACTQYSSTPWNKTLPVEPDKRSDGKFYLPNPNVTYRDVKGSLYCKPHQVPLTEVHGYWTGRPIPMISPTDEYMKHADGYPNSIGLAESLTHSKSTPERHWFRYCKECDLGLQKALSKN